MGMPIIKGSNTTKVQALTDILTSIALEEAAIAHILNAEGENFEKIIKNEENTNQDLLCVNKSVDLLADTLTNIEILLKSKMKFVLNDKCYAHFCDNPCVGFQLLLSSRNGVITPRPNTINEYDLVVDQKATLATVTVTTNPVKPVKIPAIVGVAIYAVALLNVITPDQTFEGTVTATIRFGVCQRNIVIHVSQPTPCDEYRFNLSTTTNGTIELAPNGYYYFTVTDTTLSSTIQVISNPSSTVTFTNTIPTEDISVVIDPSHTFVISNTEGGNYTGTLSATVNFENGCSRNIIIYVSPIKLIITVEEGSSLTQLSEVNHYRWDLDLGGTGSIIEIVPDPTCIIKNIEQFEYNLIGETDLWYYYNTIDSFVLAFGCGKFTNTVVLGTMSFTLIYGDGYRASIRFDIQTPED